MSAPLWVTDPAGNNDPFLKVLPSSFLLGGTDSSNNSLVDYPIGANWSHLVTVVSGGSFVLPVLGLAFGASVWIALINTVSSGSINGTAFWQSTDKGKTWTNVFTATTSDPPDQVVFANNKFVAINTSGQNPVLQGKGGTIWTSTDGTNWTSAASPVTSPLACSSLSVANNNFFIGTSDLTSVNAYFYKSADAVTWTKSGVTFGSLQGQAMYNGIPAVAVSQVLPGNVAFGNNVYAASAQYASNGYFWLTMCTSTDGLSWGSGQQFGAFTANNPHVNSGQGPVTEYNPSFVNYNIAFGSGLFVVPVAITTSNLNVTTTVPTGQEPIEFIETLYTNDYSQYDIGVMTSPNGTSWTFQKILTGPRVSIPSASYVSGGNTQINIVAYSAVNQALLFGYLVNWSSTINQFLIVLNTVLNYRIINYQTFPTGAPTFNFAGKNTQNFQTSANGTGWQQVASFSAADLTTSTTPNIKCIGVGLISNS